MRLRWAQDHSGSFLRSLHSVYIIFPSYEYLYFFSLSLTVVLLLCSV